MFKVVNNINPIGAMKKIKKPNCNLCMEELLTILNSLREKRHGYEQEFRYIRDLLAQNNFALIFPKRQWYHLTGEMVRMYNVF